MRQKMNIDNISTGSDAPDSVNVFIETPAATSPVKYETDKKSGILFVDRFMSAPLFYPANYGFIPHTLTDNGKPIDVLVVTPTPLVPGCVIASRPIGVLIMSNETGKCARILAVPAEGLQSPSDHIQSYKDLPPLLIKQMITFFEYYKVLNKENWIAIEGWDDAAKAKEIIVSSIKKNERNKE